MIRLGVCVVVLATCVPLSPGVAQEPSAPAVAPLFASNDLVTLEIVGPIKEIRDDRGDEPEYRETVVKWSASGGTGEVTARIRPRGNYRRAKRTCRHMPPLRINFRTTEVVGTVFEGQDRLKLVTHCREDDDYEQNVLEEYLAYRIYNLVTDESFRVRLAHITYTDPEEEEQLVRYGFFLEDEDRMAERLGGAIIEMDQLHPFRMAGDSEPRISVFQYMIGNTDYSLAQDHNVKIVRKENGDLLPVPYDLDWAGFVGAGYAKPAEILPIRNVRQRVYRGFCHPDKDLTEQFPRFRELQPKLDEIEAEVVGWSEDDRKRGREYLDDFFEIINDQGKADRQIVRACRQLAS